MTVDTGVTMVSSRRPGRQPTTMPSLTPMTNAMTVA